MLAKRLAVLVAAAALSAPAFADRGGHPRGHGWGNGHYRPVVVHKPHYVVHRPAVVHHYYRPAPRPVVVYHQPVVYHEPQPVNGAALLVGAVLGAAIVHHVVTGY
ncbi:MAG TPA: hypothetical protein VJQ58_08205 [Burkholderiales bacterium]|nr:hypothetical protein [Burkholderiales bacterium]